MSTPDLPQEILLEIFSRIPTKSVGKCRTLSKSWKTHLSTSNFIKKHLTFRKQTIQQENLALTTQFDNLFIITSPTKSDEFFNASLPGEYLVVLGSCNGLIFVSCSKGFILMNPVTLKRLKLPDLENQESGYSNCEYGFGYDSCSDDYKIVRLILYESESGDSTFVDVYSVKNGVWKRDNGCGFVPFRYAYEGGAFVNGALHWLVGRRGFRSCIVAFDLANEVFSEIPLPKEFVKQSGSDANNFFGRDTNCGLSVVGGCLLIVDNYGSGATDIWILKEYGVTESWVKFRIQSVNRSWRTIVAALCYVEEGELLCLTSWDYLFACDLKGGTVRKVDLGGRNDWFAHGMAFVDSLVSPEGSS